MTDVKKLVSDLNEGCPWRPVGDGSENLEVDSYRANGLMKEAAAVLQAIFDPENQPSQFGTVTLDKAGHVPV